MTITAKNLADDIVQHMRRHNCNVLTQRWDDFYQLCQRERLRKGFIDALAAELTALSITLAQGVTTIAFIKDYDFAPYASAEKKGGLR